MPHPHPHPTPHTPNRLGFLWATQHHLRRGHKLSPEECLALAPEVPLVPDLAERILAKGQGLLLDLTLRAVPQAIDLTHTMLSYIGPGRLLWGRAYGQCPDLWARVTPKSLSQFLGQGA